MENFTASLAGSQIKPRGQNLSLDYAKILDSDYRANDARSREFSDDYLRQLNGHCLSTRGVVEGVAF